MRTIRTPLLALLAASLLCSVAGAAPQSRTMQEAKAYLAAHGLKARRFKTGPPGARVWRVVVPVTRETADDFAQRFSKDNGFARLRDGHRDKGTFLFLSLEPGRIYHHHSSEVSPESHLHQLPVQRSHYRQNSRLLGSSEKARQYFLSNKGLSIPIDLRAEGNSLAHLSEWLAGARNNPTVRREWSNCMHYTCNAELAPSRTIAQHLGIRRSLDGPNLMAKVVHSANARVEVIARYVDSQAELDRMSKAELLGPEPFGGVGGAAVVAP
ncbi:MAG: hypothetical protein KC503_34210 [Myxococcales bacterium]|nr:hypothetical protein [Myxococcales bacterium]